MHVQAHMTPTAPPWNGTRGCSLMLDCRRLWAQTLSEAVCGGGGLCLSVCLSVCPGDQVFQVHERKAGVRSSQPLPGSGTR